MRFLRSFAFSVFGGNTYLYNKSIWCFVEKVDTQENNSMLDVEGEYIEFLNENGGK